MAHSLGGIICQDVDIRLHSSTAQADPLIQALHKSRISADPHIKGILECVRGIIFMGTPHCGTNLADLALIGSNFLKYFRQVNQGTLKILQCESEGMASIRQDFHTILRDCDQKGGPEIKIVCFFEALAVRGIGVVSELPTIPLNRTMAEMIAGIGAQAPL